MWRITDTSDWVSNCMTLFIGDPGKPANSLRRRRNAKNTCRPSGVRSFSASRKSLKAALAAPQSRSVLTPHLVHIRDVIHHRGGAQVMRIHALQSRPMVAVSVKYIRWWPHISNIDVIWHVVSAACRYNVEMSWQYKSYNTVWKCTAYAKKLTGALSLYASDEEII